MVAALDLGVADIAFLGHGAEHQLLAGLDQLRLAARVQPRWGLQGAGENGRFAQRQVAGRLAEIELRRCLDAVALVAEIHAVEVEIEDIVLGIVLLQPHGEQRFLDLAAERLVGGEEEVLGDLLGDGRGAAGDLTRLHALERHRGEADHVDAEMGVEAPVFDRDEGGRHIIGQLVQRHGLAAGLAAVGNQLAVGGDDANIGGAIGHLPGVGRGQLHAVVDHHGAQRQSAQDAEGEDPREQLEDDAEGRDGLALATTGTGLLGLAARWLRRTTTARGALVLDEDGAVVEKPGSTREPRATFFAGA